MVTTMQSSPLVSDIDIARSAVRRPISAVAASLGLGPEDILPYGHHIAKVPIELLARLEDRAPGKLVLVTAMTPTPMGEGKTTTTIGLAQALARIGKKVMIAIREPSLGPCFGVKGGAAGGGYSQVLPMEEINLHFTGDLHAVTAAHNLLAAVVDSHMHHKAAPELNARKVVWKRVMDMNDRSLRQIILGLGGGPNGVMREDGFEITASSEVMAILCLSQSLEDLKHRLGRIIVGYDNLARPVTAAELKVNGAMAALLKHAIQPNLVQSIEGVPAFVHGGPFANIAHGCNTLLATRMALRLADYTVTEAGFGADLGAEKFFHIKCRMGGLSPAAAVLVVTTRAVAAHGMDNVLKHADNLQRFGVAVVVAINKFRGDSAEELAEVRRVCADHGLPAHVADYREAGGDGGLELAAEVARLSESPKPLEFLYPLEAPIVQKIETIARTIYGADGVDFTKEGRKAIKRIEDLGFGRLPVCMAKTQSSLSDDPKRSGCPKGFKITVTSAKVSAGAGFVVVYTGEIMTMPGLPKVPAAMSIDIDETGSITGLF